MRCLLYTLLVHLAEGQLFFPESFNTTKEVYDEKILESELHNQHYKISENLGIQQPKLCDPNVQQYAGGIPFTGYEGNSKKFFFWLFEAREGNPAEAPLVLWLSGGPGCSSMLALFAENGPCTVNKDGSTSSNPNSWNKKANLIFVDQPAQTGFSEGAYVYGEEGVKEDFFQFLQAFYKTLPQYKKNKFYVTGESYAGHYVPAISDRIAQGGGEFEIPLAGLAIGNGLTNPEVQYKYYIPMVQDGGASEGGTTTPALHLSWYVVELMKLALIPCEQQIRSCNEGNTGSCTTAFIICNYGEMVPYQFSGYNPYDVREKCKVPPLCYDFSQINNYLNSEEVQQQLGVNTSWTECNRIVNLLFQKDFMKSYHQVIPGLLAKGIKVLVYAGDADFICNWIGNKHWTLELDWEGKNEYNAAKDVEQKMEGVAVARVRKHKNFAFTQVFAAGHMVPRDQPVVALEMLNDWIFDESKLKPTTESPILEEKEFIQ